MDGHFRSPNRMEIVCNSLSFRGTAFQYSVIQLCLFLVLDNKALAFLGISKIRELFTFESALCVGNTTDRHIVYQHVVVAAANLFHQLLQPVFHQQLRRVGGQMAGRDEVDKLVTAGNDDVVGIELCGQEVGCTHLVADAAQQ